MKRMMELLIIGMTLTVVSSTESDKSYNKTTDESLVDQDLISEGSLDYKIEDYMIEASIDNKVVMI